MKNGLFFIPPMAPPPHLNHFHQNEREAGSRYVFLIFELLFIKIDVFHHQISVFNFLKRRIRLDLGQDKVFIDLLVKILSKSAI